MFKYAFLLVILLSTAVPGCRSSFEKRVNKDIVGINEQLYDLEKEQIKTVQQLQDLKDENTQMKKEKEKTETEKNENDPDSIYKEGYKNFLEQKYPAAVELLSRLTGKFPDNPLADNALYWQAESYYKMDKIDDALNYYQLVYRYFPFSNKADYALYKIGMIFFTRNDRSKALLAFNRLTQEYPNSDLYKAASIKISQIKKDRRKK